MTSSVNKATAMRTSICLLRRARLRAMGASPFLRGAQCSEMRTKIGLGAGFFGRNQGCFRFSVTRFSVMHADFYKVVRILLGRRNRTHRDLVAVEQYQLLPAVPRSTSLLPQGAETIVLLNLYRKRRDAIESGPSFTHNKLLVSIDSFAVAGACEAPCGSCSALLSALNIHEEGAGAARFCP